MGAGDGDFCYGECGPTTPVKPARNGVFRDGPTYLHNCESCAYLLTYAFLGKEVDEHKCGGALLSGTVFRLSSEPSDETTMIESVVLRLGLNRKAAEELLELTGVKTIQEMGGRMLVAV